MLSRAAVLLTAALVVTLGSASSSMLAQAQRNANPPADIELPPITWACPMNGTVMPDGTIHADVYENEKGTCAICKMALTAVRLDSIWTCPVHSIIAEKHAGKCPIDHRDLIQITVAMSFTCGGHPEIDQLTPGKCPDGSAMAVKYTPRPHGNHNPQHGGQFFMAPDNWHHLEGAFPRAGLVRIYLYDDYTKPLPGDQIKLVTGRVVTKEAVDTATRAPKEVAFPLTLTRDGYMEAKVDRRSLPAPMVAKIKFKADGPEYRFDFTFPEFSKEPAASAPPAQLAATKAPVAAIKAPAATKAPGPALVAAPPAAPAPAPAQDAIPTVVMITPSSYERTLPIPATAEGIVAELGTHNREIRELIDRGAFTDMWVPAFQAKDLALAMNDHISELPTYKRKIVEPAITRLIRSAWLLDAFGDLGNREQIDGAYANFVAAVSEIESIFQGGR